MSRLEIASHTLDERETARPWHSPTCRKCQVEVAKMRLRNSLD